MRRKDMVPHTVLYAIVVNNMPRPGIVTAITSPPNKVKVKVWWTWTKRYVDEAEGIEDYWPEDLTAFGLTYDEKAKVENVEAVPTNQVLMPWVEYCRERKAEVEARRQARLAQDAHEARIQAEWEARVEAAFDGVTYEGSDWLRSAVKRKHHTYSAGDVLALAEYFLRRDQ